jgi:hypothetical protein
MPANATFYLSDPSLMGSRLFDALEDIERYEGLSEGDDATAVELTLAWGSITMNFKYGPELENHLIGLESYIRSVISDEDMLVYTLARVHQVRLALGCVISHEENDSDAVHEFLFAFNNRTNGLMFLYDSVFDYNGEALGGPATEWTDD